MNREDAHMQVLGEAALKSCPLAKDGCISSCVCFEVAGVSNPNAESSKPCMQARCTHFERPLSTEVEYEQG